ncbi:MAG TPA: hypothetical protein VM934_17130 [Pyrinomonadaceae bacterium]|jgi:hypothetical protein|nr:hypothetical protein [Pyrinomonadaceae bacterium]
MVDSSCKVYAAALVERARDDSSRLVRAGARKALDEKPNLPGNEP